MGVGSIQNNSAEVFSNYELKPEFLDEVFSDKNKANDHYRKVLDHFAYMSAQDFKALNDHAKLSFFNQGVTFAVYSDKAKGVERIFPYDLFRVLSRPLNGRGWKRGLFSVIWLLITLFMIYTTKSKFCGMGKCRQS